MNMQRPLAALGLLISLASSASAQTFGYEHLTNPAPNAFCSCEHAVSQYDGICAVMSWPEANSDILSYQWTPYGNAWLPYPEDDDTAYYNSIGYGGLSVTLRYTSSGYYYINLETGQRHLWYPTGAESVTVDCALGTVGWPD